MNEYPLEQWHSSELLKEAAAHLRDQPEYVPMNPEARAEMTRFCHAVRRELMDVQECPGIAKPRALHALRLKFNMPIETDDFRRYTAYVHGYQFTIIMDIPSKEED